MLCDRVQIISQGQLVFNDSLDKLSQNMHSSTLLVEFAQALPEAILSQLAGVEQVESLSASRYRLHYQPEQNPTQQLLQHAVSENWQLTTLMPEQHSLEDVFMKLIQKEDADV
jgi:ABC-2 type transport system ATP-binding protein